jgi:membrane protease YdiL (CAAX protease family)
VSAPPRPSPGPLAAVLLTLLASFLMSLAALAVLPYVTPTAAMGIASVVGLVGAGFIGAAGIPPPHAERVGLVGLARRHWLPLLLLVPVALLTSEADNVVRVLMPPPDAQQAAERVIERLPTDTDLALLESLLVAVGLVPVLEEWFFRGVIQQGLVARWGPVGGVVATALLFAVAHGGPGISPQLWAALVLQNLLLGLTLGYARYATGSLLAPILVHAGVNLSGTLALAYAASVPIAGYNAPGPYTPPGLLAASLLSVLAGAWLLKRAGPPPPIPDPPRGVGMDDS